MEKLVVFDYATHSIDIYDISLTDNRDTEEILKSLGYNYGECMVMWCSNVNINFKGVVE